MRLVVQRISQAWVSFGETETPHLGTGLLALVGFHRDDSEAVLRPMAHKLLNLRVLNDDDGRMNRSLLDAGGELALVPQFTLYADCRKGRRPSFVQAQDPAVAEGLYDQFVTHCREIVPSLITGNFGANMAVHLVNDGPVTILLDSEELRLTGRR